jgi:hypothetical protein
MEAQTAAAKKASAVLKSKNKALKEDSVNLQVQRLCKAVEGQSSSASASGDVVGDQKRP